MSTTPNFDENIKKALGALNSGQRINCPISKKDWILDEKEVAICRQFDVPPCPIEPTTRMLFLNGFSIGLTLFWKPHAFTGQPILSAIHPDSPFRVIRSREATEKDNLEYGAGYNPQRSLREQVWDLQITVPFDATRNSDVDEDSVVVGCVKTRNSFLACGSAVTNCFYTLTAIFCENSVDIGNSEKVSGSFSVGGSQHISDSVFVFESRSCFNSAFLFDCQECENCFGATNRRHKKFLWFNEQLTEGEYKKRRAAVDLSDRYQAEKYQQEFLNLVKNKALWPSVHGFGNIDSSGERLFNCVRCQECFFEHASTDCYRCRAGVNLENSCYCSATDEDHKKFGANFFPAEAEGAVALLNSSVKPLSSSEIPDSINEIDEGWIGVPIYDKTAKRTFSFLRPEIEHYKKLQIAPPDSHFIRRLHEVTQGGQLAIFENSYCQLCQKEVLVSKNERYSQRRIYCRECYLKFLEENN